MNRDEFYARLALLDADAPESISDGGRRSTIRLPNGASIAIREWGGSDTHEATAIWVRTYRDCATYQEAADTVIKWVQEVCDESR